MSKMNKYEIFDIPFMKMMSHPDYANMSFYAFIISKMNVQISKDISTAGVGWYNNKYNLVINPDFMKKLTVQERIGILIHESLHVMLKHNFRQGERDQKLYNIAADIALNQLINEPAKLPEGAMFPETFDFSKDLTADQYYELLKQEQEKQQKEKQESQDKGENWEGPSDGKPDLTNLDEDGEGMLVDSHDKWSTSGEIDEAEQELARSTMEKMIKDAIDKSKGNVPGNISDILNLWNKKAKISWKRVLKKYISSKKGSKIGTIKRRDRRQPYRKDLKGKKVYYDIPNVIVCIDTSGSMSDEEIVEGLAEINEVCKVTHSNLKVIQIDTNVTSIEEYNPKKKTFKRNGYGGTYMFSGIEYILENKIPHDVIIYISDMYIEDVSTDNNWRKVKKPVIWLNTSGTEVSWDGVKGHKIFNISDA